MTKRGTVHDLYTERKGYTWQEANTTRAVTDALTPSFGSIWSPSFFPLIVLSCCGIRAQHDPTQLQPKSESKSKSGLANTTGDQNTHFMLKQAFKQFTESSQHHTTRSAAAQVPGLASCHYTTVVRTYTYGHVVVLHIPGSHLARSQAQNEVYRVTHPREGPRKRHLP